MTIKIHVIGFGKSNWINIQLLLLLITIFASCKPKSHYPEPLTPEESMKTFHFAENFKAEIFATEPLVMDPVSMVFDGNGDAYVLEMADANMPDSLEGKCQIIKLIDKDGDGRADESVIFATGLTEATSILPWDDGIIVTAAPDILYLKDTSGDGKADKKEVIFSGFFQDNVDMQITSLCFGIDNWIYANNVGASGEVVFHRKPNAPKLSMKGADFRFRLDQNKFEAITGSGQFGQALDDWGHRLFTKNSLHIQQVVIPRRYLQRNLYIPFSNTTAVKNISDHDPLMYQLAETPYWRQVRTDRRNKVFQENHSGQVEYARGHFTGASGGTYYGGDGFSKEYYGNIFTGDVAGGLVHRDILSIDGTEPYMIAKRGEQEKQKEFMATTDTWFRPAIFSVGPDGYLYVIDMYRQHIEDPISIPDDLAAEMDFTKGNKYGRIYRIVPGDAGTYKPVTPNLKNATSADLVKALTHQNRWWRLTAQRLLLERQDKSVLSEVRDLLTKNEDPRFRLHALYVLEGMDALDAATVKTAMKDPSPGVRENATILSERFPVCLSQLEEMVNDSDIKVAFQATLSLGQFNDNTVISALAKSLELHGQSSWFRIAVLSSEAGSGIDLLKALEKNLFFNETSAWKLAFLETFSNIIGARNDKSQIVSLLDNLNKSSIANTAGLQAASIKGLIKGLEESDGLNASLKTKLKAIGTEADDNFSKAIQDLKQYLHEAN
ncbi:MAG: PVC-type heme-binding CxxCH protein [Ginsengibacter sp.]